MKYLIVVETTGTGFSAYSPDLPGCVSAGTTHEEVERNVREAIELHPEGLPEESYPVPEPGTSSAYIEVAVRAAPDSAERHILRLPGRSYNDGERPVGGAIRASTCQGYARRPVSDPGGR